MTWEKLELERQAQLAAERKEAAAIRETGRMLKLELQRHLETMAGPVSISVGGAGGAGKVAPLQFPPPRVTPETFSQLKWNGTVWLQADGKRAPLGDFRVVKHPIPPDWEAMVLTHAELAPGSQSALHKALPLVRPLWLRQARQQVMGGPSNLTDLILSVHLGDWVDLPPPPPAFKAKDRVVGVSLAALMEHAKQPDARSGEFGGASWVYREEPPPLLYVPEALQGSWWDNQWEQLYARLLLGEE